MSSAALAEQAPVARSRLIAGLLSLFGPSVGHFYAGSWRRGLAVFIAFLALPPLVIAGAFLVPPASWVAIYYILAVVAVWVAFYLFAIIDAVRLARRGENTRPRLRWYVFLGAIAAIWLGVFAVGALSSFLRPLMPSQIFSIPSTSMEPTLHIGESLWADTTYFAKHAPARGDVIIYRVPSDETAIYIKRVVALAGDRVVFRDGRAIVNGTSVPEPFADFGDPKAFLNTTAEVTVPPGHLFVAGDNRANSSDSRVKQHGPVPLKNLIARATEILKTDDVQRIGLWVGAPQR
jgi:signal peptidase I